MFQQHISIKQKLRLMMMATCGVALVFASAIFVTWFGVFWFSNQVKLKLETLADLISSGSQAPLEFESDKEAQKVIDSLKFSSDIIVGCLYGTNGAVFVEYVRSDAKNKNLAPPSHAPKPDYYSERREIVKAVTNEASGQTVGTVYLRYDQEKERDFFQTCVTVVLGSLVLASGLGLLLTARFQRYITEPVLQLLGTARKVSSNKDYTVRATKLGHDELGQLVDGFNAMLQQIQERDEKLERHRGQLEELVSDRTRELTEANAELLAAKERAEDARLLSEKANRAKSNFLSFMSHELRTPLTAINGFSEMLITDVEAEGRVEWAEDLRRIHDSGKYLLELINDILDISKIEAGKMEVHLETFDLKEMIQDAIRPLRPLVEKRMNALVVGNLANLGEVHTDLMKVRQCVLNLLSNANKFTEQGTITLEVTRAAIPALQSRAPHDEVPPQTLGGASQVPPISDRILIRVMDTGIGMTPVQVSKLFRAFTQADDSTSRKYGGTGLGLALTKQFCNILGGDVRVDSELGKGSVFTIEIPAWLPDPSHRSSLAAPAAPESTAVPAEGCVLSIDDDPAVLDLVQRVLGKQGYRVVTARTGEEGLKLARRVKPAVITLDVMMPVMDGWTVLSLLKADPELASIPVVMMTIADHKNRGFALGVSDFLTKPIDLTRLATVIPKYRKAPERQAVLIVEDDPGTREMLRRSLEKDGWEVDSAENGRVAMEKVAARRPGLILLDLMMPEMDGVEFVQNLQRRPDGSQIPIIVITSRDITEEDRRCLNGQVERIIQKGALSLEELLSEVRSIKGSPEPPTVP